METSRVLSGLSYLSVLFAGILFPIVLFFATEDKRTKAHAKKAFLSHLIPLLPTPVVIYATISQIGNPEKMPVLFISSILFTIILGLIVVIWNIIKGIQILTNDQFS
ncbi:hypothetical protein F7731_23415 [Cytobacillus depressus]|uniref:DUF4870 domain-containing protein n=1 Tax=Cytobacillus depressus TaxID=1602942 RepID=A0A6L3V0E0_9BACI|nr:DUF4870 domain-containing protein [Cytobacillus depressus]KAB2329097.1 hypothetical protein F7731_23415 [Cytobacillus depressus]